MSQEYVIGLVVTIVLGIMGSLIKRSIDGLDSKLDTTCNTVATMEKKIVGYELLAEYLKQDNTELRGKVSALEKSFNEVDKIIYAQGLRTGHPVPPPRP